jgi:hypothetical protein
MKKKRIRIISTIIIAMLLFMSNSFAFAANNTSLTEDVTYLIEKNDLSFENKFLTLYMKNVMKEDINIVDVTQISDLTGVCRYLYYEINNGKHLGYAILNADTLSVTECAFDHVLPFKVNKNILYGGPLVYLEFDNSSYQDKMSGKEVNTQTIQNMISFQKNSLLPSILSDNEKADMYLDLSRTQSVINTISGSGNTSWVFNTGSYQGDCGVNAVAMVEKYYDLYVNSNYLPSSLSTEQQIKNSIANYILGDMAYPDLSLSESEWASVITQHSMSVGLSGYYLYSYSETYNWISTVQKIDDNRPMTISIKNHPTYGYHYVVVAGYSDTADLSTSRLYVNTGWSSHGFVWIDQSYGYRQMPCI